MKLKLILFMIVLALTTASMNFLTDETSDIFKRIKNAQKQRLDIEIKARSYVIKFNNLYFIVFEDHINVLTHDFTLLNRVDFNKENYLGISGEFLITNISAHELTKVHLLTGEVSSFKIHNICNTVAPKASLSTLDDGFVLIRVVCDETIWDQSDNYVIYYLVYDIFGYNYNKLTLKRNLWGDSWHTCFNNHDDIICFLHNARKQTLEIVNSNGVTLRVFNNIYYSGSINVTRYFSDFVIDGNLISSITFETIRTFSNQISSKDIFVDEENYIFSQWSKYEDSGHYEIPFSLFPQTPSFPPYNTGRFIPGSGKTTYYNKIIGRNINTNGNFSSEDIEYLSTFDSLESDRKAIIGLFKHSENQLVVFREEYPELWTY